MYGFVAVFGSSSSRGMTNPELLVQWIDNDWLQPKRAYTGSLGNDAGYPNSPEMWPHEKYLANFNRPEDHADIFPGTAAYADKMKLHRTGRDFKMWLLQVEKKMKEEASMTEDQKQEANTFEQERRAHLMTLMSPRSARHAEARYEQEALAIEHLRTHPRSMTTKMWSTLEDTPVPT